jgi:hypothetical protein
MIVLLVIIFSAGATSYFLWAQREKTPAAVTNDVPLQPPPATTKPALSTTPAEEAKSVAQPIQQTAAVEPAEPAASAASEAPAVTTDSALALANPPAKAAAPEDPLQGWKTPTVAFVVTGQAHGYIEPCGCSERQVGGYARRADLIRGLREDRKWPVVAVDVGGMLNPERTLQAQAKYKLQALVTGLVEMKYDAMAIGAEELQFGPTRLFEMYQEFKNINPDFPLPFLGANLTIIDKSLGMPLDYTIVQRGGKKIAIISIFGDEWRSKVSSLSPDELKVDGVEATLKRVLGEVKQKEKPDLLVLLSHDSLDNSKKWAEKFQEFQLVVSAGGYEEPPKTPDIVGRTMVITSGIKGKTVGVVGYFPEDRQRPFQYTNIEIAPELFKNAPEMIQVMRDYQKNLEENWTSLISLPIASDDKFVGVASCKDCHTKAYEAWKTSPHAKAYHALEVGRESQRKTWVSRIFDPECLCCHNVGWNAEKAELIAGGFTTIKETPLLADQQCENCHGPGGKHVELEMNLTDVTAEVLAGRKKMKRSIKAPGAEADCRKCHDGENDLNWESVGFENRWKVVAHPGLD